MGLRQKENNLHARFSGGQGNEVAELKEND